MCFYELRCRFCFCDCGAWKISRLTNSPAAQMKADAVLHALSVRMHGVNRDGK